MKAALEDDMQALLAEMQRLAAPRDSDRQRMTDALRARLGAAVVDGLVPGGSGADTLTGSTAGAGQGIRSTGSDAAAARAQLSTGVWLKIAVSTGILSGALGFALGYHLKGSASSPALVSIASSAAANAGEAPAESSSLPPTPPGALEPAATEPAALATNARPLPPRAARTRAPSRAVAAPRPGSAEAAWPFSEVLERLRRANLALGRGQASLALLLLAEIDRHAGGTLGEERDVTRVLALCSLGEDAAAQRVAAPLLAGDASSIYRRRLEQSCAAPARR